MTALLERVSHQHGGDGEEAEEGETIHAVRQRPYLVLSSAQNRDPIR